MMQVPKNVLPGKAKIIDRVALLRLEPEAEQYEEEIGRLTLEYYGVRSVYRMYGVEGVERRPVLKHLAGERVREITHREYGYILRLDLERLMLSLGNSFERLRVAGLTGRNEVLVDMFAGVGQFTIPIAVLSSPRRIYSIEINPEAFRYLEENVRLNNVGDIVEPLLGDCRMVVEERLQGVADRVIMGYLMGTVKALPQALKALRKAGGVIHFHELVRRGWERRFAEELLGIIKLEGYEARLLGWRRVKSYSRTRNHIVLDILVARRLE